MFEWISELLASSAPAEFESSYSLAESVSRLRLLVNEAFYGEVATKDVYFRGCIHGQDKYGRPGRSSTQTCFAGEFQVRGGRVFLVGSFSLSIGAKLLLVTWVLGGTVALMITGALALLGKVPFGPPLFSALVFVTGNIALWFAQLDAKAQAEAMAKLITRCFS